MMEHPGDQSVVPAVAKEVTAARVHWAPKKRGGSGGRENLARSSLQPGVAGGNKMEKARTTF